MLSNVSVKHRARCAVVKVVDATKNIFLAHRTATVLQKMDVAIHLQNVTNIQKVFIQRILTKRSLVKDIEDIENIEDESDDMIDCMNYDWE